MIQFSFSDVIGYVVAAVAAGLGIAVIAGILNLNIEPTARYLFGAIFILIGVYRLAVTRFRARAEKRRREMRDDDQ
jgi:hypothetical protein